jgi:hypothetical protein
MLSISKHLTNKSWGERFDVLRVVTMKITVSWDITAWRLVDMYGDYGGRASSEASVVLTYRTTRQHSSWDMRWTSTDVSEKHIASIFITSLYIVDCFQQDWHYLHTCCPTFPILYFQRVAAYERDQGLPSSHHNTNHILANAVVDIPFCNIFALTTIWRLLL